MDQIVAEQQGGKKKKKRYDVHFSPGGIMRFEDYKKK